MAGGWVGGEKILSGIESTSWPVFHSNNAVSTDCWNGISPVLTSGSS